MVATVVGAQTVSYTTPGATITENFDSMGAAGTAPPSGWFTGSLGGVANLGQGALPNNVEVLLVSNGSVNTVGRNFNCGITATGERALGASGNTASERGVEVRIVNNTGFAIKTITITYDGEVWRTPQTVTTAALTNMFSTNGVNFVKPGAAFDFVKTMPATAAAVDGNAAANRTAGIGGTYVLPSPVTNGGTLYIRWYKFNDSGFDPTLAIDNFTFTAFGDETCVAITNQPMSITVPERGITAFSLIATGAPQNIQWYRSDNGGASYAAIPLANNGSYTIPSVVYPGDNGARFRATVSNSTCNVTSSVAVLTVQQDQTVPSVISAIGDVDPTVIHLTFSEPMLAGSVNDPAYFTVFLTGGDPDFDYLISVGTLGVTRTNVTLITEARTFGVNYSLRIVDVRDDSSAQNVIDPNPSIIAIRPTLLLIGFDTDNEWKYNQTRADLGTAWRANGYDDTVTGWQTGPALFEAKNGTVPAAIAPLVGTTLTLTNPPNTEQTITYYFRTHFVFTNSLAGAELRLRHYLDDGGIFYLNGQEAYRARMTNSPDGYLTLAAGTANGISTAVTDAAIEPVSALPAMLLPLTNMVSGSNLVAVEVHQSAANSSDITFAMELVLIIPSFSPAVAAPPPLAIQHIGTNAIISWSGTGFTLQGVGTLLSSGTAWTNITGATSPHTNSTAGGQRFFRLRN